MTATYSDHGLVWEPMSCEHGDEITARIQKVLESWRYTRYMAGQQTKGEKGVVDCVRFVFGVIDELYGRQFLPSPRLPQDTAWHSRRGAMKALHTMRRIYGASERVRRDRLQPGDVVITGPPGGGPGHAMIVGGRKNTLWHCVQNSGVCQTGIGFFNEQQRIFAVYRFSDREGWAHVS